MTEWKLYNGGAPEYSRVEFFRNHPWVPPSSQSGHAERTAMVEKLVRGVVRGYKPVSLTDLGCGDGSLLEAIRDLPVEMWGYDAGTANVQRARNRGLDVEQRDILAPGLSYGDLIVCCEVVEHLADPHEFITSIPGRLLVLSSPSAETDEWHYGEHAWAWDVSGYAQLVKNAGWRIEHHLECDGGVNWHGDIERPQRFQAVFAVRG